MKNFEIKLLTYDYPEGWTGGKFVLQVDGEMHCVHNMLIPGYYYPEGNLYFEVFEDKSAPNKLLYKNCEHDADKNEFADGCKRINAVFGIGSVVTVARILQGYDIERTGHYFNSFLNDKGTRQAIVYPYPEMDWDAFKGNKEAAREEFLFEKVKRELIEKGFVQNEQGFWVQ